MPPRINERTLVFLLGAVQFVNILDFMIVMPLGPDFAVALGIPTSQLGLVNGSYTAAAALAGFVGSFFLDRFDRRKALAVAMAGLVVGTAAAALAGGLRALMVARLVAGAFGGPATSLAFAIIADVIPAERRGKALGAVMGAFAAASVLGVPAGLELARWGGWRLPFLAVAGLGTVVSLAAILRMPSLRGHLDAQAGGGVASLGELLRRPVVLASFAMTATMMMGGFIIIPNVAAYVQQNLGYPRADLDVLYLVGGVMSFGTVRLVGRLVDRFGSFRVGSLGAAMLIAVLYFWFIAWAPGTPVLLVFVAFMFAMGFRNVSCNTLATKVPLPRERARFLSLQSTVQHLASAAGAIGSTALLVELPNRRLAGVERLGWISIGLTAVLPALLYTVERRVRARDEAQREPTPSDMPGVARESP